MTIAIGMFLVVLWNTALFLKIAKLLFSTNKRKATLFAVLALIISLIPWLKNPMNDNVSNSQSAYESMY